MCLTERLLTLPVALAFEERQLFFSGRAPPDLRDRPILDLTVRYIGVRHDALMYIGSPKTYPEANGRRG